MADFYDIIDHLCKHCHRGIKEHSGPKLKCLFEPTHFEEITYYLETQDEREARREELLGAIRTLTGTPRLPWWKRVWNALRF